MSREGAPSKQSKPPAPTATPIWVWIVYGLGILATAIFLFSALFTAGAYFLSGDVPVSLNVSLRAIVLWGGLVVAAVVTWLWRRGGRR